MKPYLSTPIEPFRFLFLKDGTGMIGRILFAYYQGSSLDSNSKMWRLYADILNDFSFFVDLTTPFFPRAYSIYFVSFSSLLRVKL
jgi:hypothetical protein